MKYSNIHRLLLVLILPAVTLSSCSFIEGVFKAGMGVGIFLVVLVIAVVIYIMSRMGKK
jgi:hypothetical protein